ncbi:conserved protein of unknown function [Ruminococcaceae bacterium BL-6]|nr:conserved protein of unknown function [Ruminococcaceae bacterium BL-6]
MRLLIIDGQGGGIGSRLVSALAPCLPAGCVVVCVGTNVIATNAMLKAGGRMGATGENAVRYNAARADLILGPIGIILANAMLGEITPSMASAVSGSDAVKILIPSAKCSVYLAGAQPCTLEESLKSAVSLALREIGRLRGGKP